MRGQRYLFGTTSTTSAAIVAQLHTANRFRDRAAERTLNLQDQAEHFRQILDERPGVKPRPRFVCHVWSGRTEFHLVFYNDG